MRNLDIWKVAHMYPMAKVLRNKRLIWFGHVQRRDKYEATRKILQMTVDGKVIYRQNTMTKTIDDHCSDPI